MTRKTTLLLIFGFVLLAIIVSTAWLRERKPVPLRISEETTFFTEPLTEDGSVDYAAALNLHFRKDTLPETNAVILLQQAVGPSEKVPTVYYDELGMEQLPEEGDYLRKLDREFLSEQGLDAVAIEQYLDDYGLRLSQPWRRADDPVMAVWIDLNERPLKLVHQAAVKNDYYSPLTWNKESPPGEHVLLLSILNYQPENMGFISRTLRGRAMMRLGEGDEDGAWSDLLACRRLGRLATRGPTVFDSMAGHRIDADTYSAMLTLLKTSESDTETLEDYLRALSQLPPSTPIIEILSHTERCHFLDAVCSIASGKIDGRAIIGKEGRDKLLAAKLIDWNAALIRGNAYHDQIIAAAMLSTHVKRCAATEKVFTPLKDNQSLEGPVFWRSPTSNGTAMGDLVAALMLPAVTAFYQIETESNQREANLNLALALMKYRLDHESYPKKLRELSPEYIPEISKDLFSDTSLLYKSINDRFLLYSVGPNLRDDGGIEDRPADQDDISVRFGETDATSSQTPEVEN